MSELGRCSCKLLALGDARSFRDKQNMDYNSFYSKLFAPLESLLGSIDVDTLVAVIGFDEGGPLNFCIIGLGSPDPIRTYVSCEMAIREE